VEPDVKSGDFLSAQSGQGLAKINPFAHGHSGDRRHAGLIKPEYSPINLLGRCLYRRQAPWEQRRKTVILLWAITTGLIFGAACVALILFQNSRR
jgi:hypothetical protein